MKRTFLLCLLLLSFMELFAQWVDDPMNNTFIANCNKAAGEIYVATDQLSGDTYVQWDYQGDNGWSPWVQRLNSEGEPQWPADGIHITTPDFATWSPGYAMTTVEGGVVSTFRTLGPPLGCQDQRRRHLPLGRTWHHALQRRGRRPLRDSGGR